MHLQALTKFASTDEFRANLVTIAERLQAVGTSLYQRIELGTGCRVYPAIADSTARQLQLLARLVDEPIEITASVCRTVFEINVVFRYCFSSPQHLDDYAIQAATDEISIYKSLRGLANGESDANDVKVLDSHIEQMRATLLKHGKSLKPDRPSLFQMAKAIGLEEEYQSFYGIYSKYVHASAWFVLRKREHIDLPMYRLPMQIHAQLYGADTLERQKEIQRNTEKGDEAGTDKSSEFPN